MKLFLLKVLLQRRNRDEGFTLPMVIALGLVMILLGTTNIVKSSEENLNASIQNSSSDALAVAEVGITKYRELLNQNRILTIYNHDQWTSNATVTGQTCDRMTQTPTGWFDDTNPSTNVSPNSTTQWWEIREDKDGDGTDELIGEYKLVSYEYDIDGDSIAADEDNNGILDDITPNDENGNFSPDDDNVSTTDSFTFNDTNYNPRGLLTVQGRSTDGSEAQIQVEIPLRINDLDNLDPVLWIGDNTTSSTDLSGVTVNNGNVVIKDSPTSSADGCGDFSSLANGALRPVISDSRNLPSIDRVKNIVNEAGYNSKMNTTYSSGDYFGQVGDTEFTVDSTITNDPAVGLKEECEVTSDLCFFYDLGGLSIQNVNAETDGVANVTVYVDGTVDIDLESSSSESFINIGSSTSSDYFELYVDNGNAITIDVASGKTVNINGFIHAPTSTLTISGGGTVNIDGSVWVSKLVNNNNTAVNITIDQTDTATGFDSSYKFYTTSVNRTPRPLTSSPTNWVREEVQ